MRQLMRRRITRMPRKTANNLPHSPPTKTLRFIDSRASASSTKEWMHGTHFGVFRLTEKASAQLPLRTANFALGDDDREWHGDRAAVAPVMKHGAGFVARGGSLNNGPRAFAEVSVTIAVE